MVDVSCERFQTLEIGTLERHSDVPNPKVSALVGITSVYEHASLHTNMQRSTHPVGHCLSLKKHNSTHHSYTSRSLILKNHTSVVASSSFLKK